MERQNVSIVDRVRV